MFERNKKTVILWATLLVSFVGCVSDELDTTATPATLSEDGALQSVEITVDHAYIPNVIDAQAGLPLDLIFTRKESMDSCAQDLVVPVADYEGNLPNGESVLVHVPAQEVGDYPFHCSMDMMKGVISFK